MTEGMNISSVRGSFRIAYNASKILSLTTKKDSEGLVCQMMIKTTANREKGSLDTIVNVNNLNIIPEDNPMDPQLQKLLLNSNG